ncbi:diguanylate cyclase [Thermodesulfobium narugense]|uniref:diguanylate cyclase n=1 Tax=Thermodesulfobium narugense TaxID=184064 RepID=UPI00145F27F7|nr:diguanylate cyclase [Thermodesulfobium narugense]
MLPLKVLYIDLTKTFNVQISNLVANNVETLETCTKSQDIFIKIGEFRPDLVIFRSKNNSEIPIIVNKIKKDFPDIFLLLLLGRGINLKFSTNISFYYVDENFNQLTFLDFFFNLAKEINQQKMIVSDLKFYKEISFNIQNFVFVCQFDEIVFMNKNLLNYIGLSSLSEFNEKNLDIYDFFYPEEKSLYKGEGLKEWLVSIRNRGNKKNENVVFLKNSVLLKEFSIEPFWLDYSEIKDGEIVVISLFRMSNLDKYRNFKIIKRVRNPITNLYDKKVFLEELKKETQRSIRYKRPLSLIFLSNDNYNSIYSKFGKEIAHRVLREFCNRINDSIRSLDLFCSYSKNKFTILCPETDVFGALFVAKRIRTMITSETFSHGENLECTLGVTQYQPQEDIDIFVQRAIEAWNKSKQSGGKNIETILVPINY